MNNKRSYANVLSGVYPKVQTPAVSPTNAEPENEPINADEDLPDDLNFQPKEPLTEVENDENPNPWLLVGSPKKKRKATSPLKKSDWKRAKHERMNNAASANAVKRKASSRPLNEGAKKRKATAPAVQASKASGPRHEGEHAGRVSKKPSTKVINHVVY